MISDEGGNVKSNMRAASSNLLLATRAIYDELMP